MSGLFGGPCQRRLAASTFAVTDGAGLQRAHPAISDGRLYIRHGNVLLVYDSKA